VNKVKRPHSKNWRQVEGRNPVLECFKAGNKVFQLFIEEGVKADPKIKQILKLARNYQVPVIKKGRKNLARLSQTDNHQGVIAIAEELPNYSLKYILRRCAQKNKAPFLVILPEILYAYNLGSVFRTAEGAGVDAVIIDKRAQLGPVVTSVAMGAVEHLPIIRENLFSALNLLLDEGIKIVAAEPSASKIYYNADLTLPLALIIGSENVGIKQNLLTKSCLKIKIPMLGRINSLNLGVSAAIILYESVRQQLCEKKT